MNFNIKKIEVSRLLKLKNENADLEVGLFTQHLPRYLKNCLNSLFWDTGFTKINSIILQSDVMLSNNDNSVHAFMC